MLGEKGASGKEGPPGPSGPIGTPGVGGKRGHVGPPGVNGEKGDKGSVGAPGIRGETGTKGRQGQKGSLGLKGNKGIRGLVGIQGPKGECAVPPKISVYPVSQEVFINETAIFFCWVQGHTSSKITWRKLGGTVSDATVENGSLRINSVQRSHVGSYMCSANTGLESLRGFSTLQVKEPPTFVKKLPSLVIVDEGSVLNLCCDAVGSPPPKVEWSRAGNVHSADTSLAFQERGCLKFNTVEFNSHGKYVCRARNRIGLAETTTSVVVKEKEVLHIYQGMLSNPHQLISKIMNALLLVVYCDITASLKGWTLLARFSNSDGKNWMRDDGRWWYDQHAANGATNDPSVNTDMISPAFWL
ncbi:hypothetical protein pdam_00020921, partial [Pocillopora damicornis]